MKTRALLLSLFVAAALPLTAAAQAGDPPAKQNDPAEKAAPQAKERQADPAQKQNMHISRAVFTSEVVDHEPVDHLQAVPAGLDRVYYFTEIKDLDGAMITHRWMLDGETVAEVPIKVEGPRWRAFSVKDIQPGETGTWTVQVLDADGNVLNEATLPPQAKALEHGQS